MNPGLLASVFLPLGSLMAIGGSIVYRYAKLNAETVFEKDLKEVRKRWFRGQIDGNTYRYIKNSMQAEELLNVESEKLDRC